MTTVEKAPCRRGITSTIASSMSSAGWVASSAAMISESEVDENVTPALAQLGVQLDRVDQVAVVGQRELAAVAAGAVGAMDGLRVLPLVGARRGVADVADRQVAAERAQLVLAEDLRDEAERALGDDVAAVVGGRDPRRLLAAVLERVEGEVREAGDVVLGRVDAEDAALVTRSVAMVEGRRQTHCGRRLAAGSVGAERCALPHSAPCGKASGMPVVTISAAYGTGGSRIGPAVAERLGCHFVDRAIPVEVAARLNVDVEEARVHDGRASSGLVGMLARMPNLSGVVLPEVENPLFQRETERLIHEAARSGQVVVLGRAGAMVLRDHPGALHVRLDGETRPACARRWRVEEVDRREAAKRMKETDSARAAYVRQFYGCDARSPRHYHLVLDTPALGLEACVELIVAAAAARERAPA